MADSARLALLRRSLEQVESRRASAAAELFASGHEELDRALGGGLARGRLHEIFAGEEDAGSGAAFAAALTLRARRRRRPMLWLRTERVERQAGRLHATGLGELGFDPATLLLGLVPDEKALLRAAADAAHCAGIDALLVECWGSVRDLDLTATRRLMLAAETTGVTLFLLRIAADASASAADTRWRVGAAPSVPLEAAAPGAPMFELELLRRRAGPSAGPWRVEWDRDRRSFQDPSRTGAQNDAVPAPVAQPALSGAVLPLAADRPAAADAAAPLRRTG